MYCIRTERLQLRFFGENYEWINMLHRKACHLHHSVISVGICVKVAALRVKNCITQFTAVRFSVP